jgi:hypothetical protein
MGDNCLRDTCSLCNHNLIIKIQLTKKMSISTLSHAQAVKINPISTFPLRVSSDTIIIMLFHFIDISFQQQQRQASVDYLGLLCVNRC